MSRDESSDDRHLALLRALAQAWQGVERHVAADIRHSELSVPQFDILCTLGDTPGMTFTELGELTLIYKTTLTGVVDRLESKGLVMRQPCDRDRRCIYVRLTAEGERRYRELFPAHRANLRRCLDALSDAEVDDAVRLLHRIRDLWSPGTRGG